MCNTKGELRLKLEVAVKDVSSTRRELTIEIPVDEVSSAYDKSLDEYTRHARIPGFRQGRAPRSIIKQRFTKELRDEVLSKLLPEALSHAVIHNKLRPLGEPDLRIDQSAVRQGEPIRFDVLIEVAPNFELRSYRGLNLTRYNVVINDEDVDKLIDSFRQRAAEFVTVDDRTAEMGDFVSVNILGKYVQTGIETGGNAALVADQDPTSAKSEDSTLATDDHNTEDLKVDDLQIELGGEGVHPDFTTNLSGVKADDVRQFRVAYPPDFTSKGLAGKTLDFTVNVIAVRRKELPLLDDENVGQFGNYESVEQLRAEIFNLLKSQYSARTNEWIRADLIAAVIAEYDFEVPERFFNTQYGQRAQELIQKVYSGQLSPDQVASLNIRKELKLLKSRIYNEIRTGLILQRIGETEGIKVQDEDVEAVIARRAAAAGISGAEMYQRLTKNDAISTIESELFYDKTLGFLLGLAEITDSDISTIDAAKRDEEVSFEDEEDELDAVNTVIDDGTEAETNHPIDPEAIDAGQQEPPSDTSASDGLTPAAAE